MFTASWRPSGIPVVNVVVFVLILSSVIPVFLATRISSSVAEARA